MRFSERKEDDLAINLTPLIDVVFLLLIFFMVSTTFSKESELNIRLPDAQETKPEEQDQNVVIVEVSSEGIFAVRAPGEAESKRLVDSEAETLMRALKQAVAGDNNMVTIIRADENTPHQFVIRAMDASRRLGLLKITFATQQGAAKEG